MIDNAAWRIQHALAYPFDPPDCSYLFSAGEMQGLAGADFQHRVPVLASGSNGSPARLREKFGTEGVIPVTRVRLHGLITAYAARITSYGSVPATLAAAPRATTIVHCTWLTGDQLEIMHQSESIGVGYAFSAVDPGICQAIDGPHPTDAAAYISLSGFLPDGNGKPVSLELHDQSAAQAIVRSLIDHDDGQDSFIASNILNPDHRARVNRQLAPHGVPIKHASLTRLV